MILKFLCRGVATVIGFIIALAFADNFLRDDGTFQPITSSSQSITNGNGLTLTPSPCVGACSIGITAPVSSPNGGTGVVSPTAHTIPVNEGASAQANTGTGTTGQCVGSGGASADPSYLGGCWRLLNTLTASASATLSDTSSMTSTYSEYLLIFENLLPTNNNSTCEIQVHSGGTFKNTTYLASVSFGALGGVSNVTTYIPCSQATNVPNSGGGISGHIMAFNPSSSAQATMWGGLFFYIAATAQLNQVGGIWNSAAATDGFQIVPVAGASPTWASGSVKLYGRL